MEARLPTELQVSVNKNVPFVRALALLQLFSRSCNPALMWCSQSLSSYMYSSPEECFFSQTPVPQFGISVTSCPLLLLDV